MAAARALFPRKKQKQKPRLQKYFTTLTVHARCSLAHVYG